MTIAIRERGSSDHIAGMSEPRHPDPKCPYCHGTGVLVLAAPFLDRIDESTTPCRCVLKTAEDYAEATLEGDDQDD